LNWKKSNLLKNRKKEKVFAEELAAKLNELQISIPMKSWR
jgi:hypothetical protein